MKFSLNISMCDPAHYKPIAQAAEAAGFHSIAVPDSICYPKESDTIHPYSGKERDFLDNEPFIETLIAVTHMAAVTQSIEFFTYVYKLPVRQAAVVAKQVQSIQCLSDNRLNLGIGISPWPEDFAVTGVPWEKRGKRFDEQIEILRGLETGNYFGFSGEHHSMPENKMSPVPGKLTPLLIAGHTEVALKRAARLGDGWACGGADLTELERYIQRIQQLREAYGTADKPFKIITTGQDAFSNEGIAQLEALGVDTVVIGFRNVYEKQPDQSLQEKINMLQWYAGEFITGK